MDHPLPSQRPVRLAYLVSHPIQYQAPLLRRIAAEPDIDLTVFFASDFSARQYRDRGFGVGVDWDVPLLDGYRYDLLPNLRDQRRTGPLAQINYGLWSRLRAPDGHNQFDLLWVHGYSTFTMLLGIVAAKALGIPVLLRAESRLRQDSAAGRIAKHLFFSVLRPLVDAVLPIGTANAAFWSRYLGDSLPHYSMPYAVDNAYFQRLSNEATTTRSAFLASLGLDESRPVILFASKLQPRKRCANLIEAYQRLIARRQISPAPYLLIVGDGEQRADLEEQARQTGCEDIRFCGFRNQSELPRFFEIATVFVLPSEDEQWGLVVNEVMNAGRPVIVSDQTGCQLDLVTDGVEGCVFPTGDIAALEDALLRVLRDPREASAMGARALERVQCCSFEEDLRGLRRAIAAQTKALPADRRTYSKESEPTAASTAMLNRNL